MKMITARQMKFLSHVNREEKVEDLAATGKLAGDERKVNKRLHLCGWEFFGQHVMYCKHQRIEGLGLT